MNYASATDLTPIYIFIGAGAVIAVVIAVARFSSAPKKKHKQLK